MEGELKAYNNISKCLGCTALRLMTLDGNDTFLASTKLLDDMDPFPLVYNVFYALQASYTNLQQ